MFKSEVIMLQNGLPIKPNGTIATKSEVKEFITKLEIFCEEMSEGDILRFNYNVIVGLYKDLGLECVEAKVKAYDEVYGEVE